jgi:ribosomal protein S18 acetylase RimI-like enzyme
MVWQVTPTTRPADLGRYLLAHGLEDMGDEPGMALGLQRLPDDLPTPSGFAVECVDTLEALQAWCSFAGEPAVTRALVAWGQAVGFAPDRRLVLYLGRLGGRPVATATLVLGGEAAGIYNVMTIPEVQRQGIGALMTTIPLRAARARGYRLGVLESSNMGLRLYRRLGFQEYCRIERYRWDPPGAPPSQSG